MNTRGTGMRPGELVERLGNAALFLVVAFPLLWFGYYYMSAAGIDHTLHTYNLIHTWDAEAGRYSVVPLRMGIELVALPLAAIAGVWLRWGTGTIAALRTSRISPLLPLLGAAAVLGMFWHIEWFWSNPQDLLGVHPQYGVQRWIGVALLASVGYVGMILFPRLTASMAGAFGGPALFALVGYTFFPSFMKAASSRNTITDAEARLADMLVDGFWWGALAVAITAILAMLLSKRLRQRPLTHAVWMGALMLCLAVSGTFSGGYLGR